MAKGQKSSATSGTRKKNARRAAQATQEPPPSPVPKQSKPKGGKNTKLSKREAREQRKKVYIPPTKPVPPVLDPLDTTGLAHLLPPELVVVLRALGKKDAVTRGKAIAELAKWVEEAINEQAMRDHDHDRYEEEGGKAAMVVKMLPVWVCLHTASGLGTTNFLCSSIVPLCSSPTLHGVFATLLLPSTYPFFASTQHARPSSRGPARSRLQVRWRHS